GIRDRNVTGVQTCALPISAETLPNGQRATEPGSSRPHREPCHGLHGPLHSTDEGRPGPAAGAPAVLRRRVMLSGALYRWRRAPSGIAAPSESRLRVSVPSESCLGGLEVVVQRAEELLGGQVSLVAADEQRQVLGHLAALDGLDDDVLEEVAELDHVRRVVEFAAVLQAPRPREDR